MVLPYPLFWISKIYAVLGRFLLPLYTPCVPGNLFFVALLFCFSIKYFITDKKKKVKSDSLVQ